MLNFSPCLVFQLKTITFALYKSYDLAHHKAQSYCKIPQTAVPKKYSGLLFEKTLNYAAMTDIIAHKFIHKY